MLAPSFISIALTDPESPIVKHALQLNKKVLGVSSALSGSGPANLLSYMLIGHDIPTITGYSPLGGNFHSANEYVDIESVERSLRLLTDAEEKRY